MMETEPSVDCEVLSEMRLLLQTGGGEAGGILGGRRMRHISAFFHDVNARSASNEYHPCLFELYSVIDVWRSQGIRFLGFIHTHPREWPWPSMADMAFAKECIQMNSRMEFLYMGILTEEQLTLTLLRRHNDSEMIDEYFLPLKENNFEIQCVCRR